VSNDVRPNFEFRLSTTGRARHQVPVPDQEDPPNPALAATAYVYDTAVPPDPGDRDHSAIGTIGDTAVAIRDSPTPSCHGGPGPAVPRLATAVSSPT
jgi:hypothetical protein